MLNYVIIQVFTRNHTEPATTPILQTSNKCAFLIIQFEHNAEIFDH